MHVRYTIASAATCRCWVTFTISFHLADAFLDMKTHISVCLIREWLAKKRALCGHTGVDSFHHMCILYVYISLLCKKTYWFKFVFSVTYDILLNPVMVSKYQQVITDYLTGNINSNAHNENWSLKCTENEHFNMHKFMTTEEFYSCYIMWCGWNFQIIVFHESISLKIQSYNSELTSFS